MFLVTLERFDLYLLLFSYCMFHHTIALVQTSFNKDFHHHRSMGKIILQQSSSNQMLNCSNELCSKDLNLICDQNSGECKCPVETPVRLSDEIPCLKYKRLGELCIHADECSLTQHATCVATFLFSMKILSKKPTYKQWFFYNKIHNDDDMNYLLNKLYGRCRCQKGFRAIKPFECIYAGVEAPYRCHHETDCIQINAHCYQNRCICSLGSHYDNTKGYCDAIINLYGKFCASSSDCFSHRSNMECKNSICICSPNYIFYNKTGCIRKDICRDGTIWNNTSKSCQSETFTTITFCSLMIKSLPLFLFMIIIFNLICYVRNRKSNGSSSIRNHQREIHDLSWRYNLDHYERMNQSNQIQSYSLLSLPDYETIFNEERLPTYEEAVRSLKTNCSSQNDNLCGKLN